MADYSVVRRLQQIGVMIGESRPGGNAKGACLEEEWLEEAWLEEAWLEEA